MITKRHRVYLTVKLEITWSEQLVRNSTSNVAESAAGNQELFGKDPALISQVKAVLLAADFPPGGPAIRLDAQVQDLDT